MDLYLFVDINNPDAGENQAWSKEKRTAVVNGLESYVRRGGKIGVNLQHYVDNRCIGPVFETCFQYH